MKKRALLALLFALALLVGQISLPVATAVTNYDPCEAGDHAYDVETIPGTYGGRRYFTVSSCAYASESHTHYYITTSVTYVYSCRYCGYTKTVESQQDDTDMGEFCMLHDLGR